MRTPRTASNRSWTRSRTAQHANPSFRIEEFGYASANHVLSHVYNEDFAKAEKLSIPFTLVVLLLAFGSLVAAGIPVVLAFSAVLAAIGLNEVLSHLVPAADAAKSVILLVGMAVGVDYSLFYLRREREERAGGLEPHAALARAAATSGLAVLISGGTVLIAMAGMFFAGHGIFTSIALGAMTVVFVAMVGSLTVLPALLHKLGDKVERGRIPFLGRLQRPAGESRLWGAILRPVLRRPAIAVTVGGGALLLATLPVLGMHTKLPSYIDLPHSLPIVRAYEHITEAFPGSQTPAEVVVQAPDVTAPEYERVYQEAQTKALATGLLFQPFHVFVNPDKTVARIELSVAGSGDDATSYAALRTLRNDVIAPLLPKLPDATVAVTGQTAGTYDFNELMKSRAPFVIGFVLALAFLLLLITFRSIVIPLTAIVLNLLSVGAAYGLLIMIFQWGHLEGALGYRSNHAIAAWLPLFLFVDPLRPLDGLPRVHHQPDQGAARPRALDRAGGGARHPADGRDGDDRGDRDGRGLRDLRRAARDRRQADGRRARARDPDRRDRDQGGAASGDHEAPRRMELVSAAVARASTRRASSAATSPSTSACASPLA